jgi:cytochrome oxidase Cu insertion factor (SCO1/SenC/PrrC family)
MGSKFVNKFCMAKYFLFTFLLFTSSFLFAQEKPEGLFINSKAPDFKATDQYGKEIRLKDVLKDSLVVLIFYRENGVHTVSSI